MRRIVDRFAMDRRTSRRHAVKAPLRVRLWKSSIPEQVAESSNISADGMCFATDLTVAVGTVVEVLRKMPTEVTGEPTAEWRCTGHVVRVEPVESTSAEQRVGVQFDCYQVSRS